MVCSILGTHVATAAEGSGDARRDATPVESSLRERDRVRGLLLGSFVGDALGGPIEFQDPAKVRSLSDPPRTWARGERLDDAALAATVARLRLRSYADLRPVPEPYAHWTTNAAPGTITDDSRHKLVLFHALRTARRQASWPLTREGMARAFLQWPEQGKVRDTPGWPKLCDDWLLEWWMGSRWVLGERDVTRALPPERMWTGLPTCCGQMTLPPLAALYPGDPEAAYRAAYQVAFFDNGIGLDLNCALIAGLAEALAVPEPTSPAARSEAWERVFAAMVSVDPYRYGQVPWTPRPAVRWLNWARTAARESRGEPAALFERLEKEFQQTIKWEAQVPYVVTFACLELARFDPLAALELSLEWGHDTDSYASLVGAFIGALHGADLFPDRLRKPVEERLQADYGEDLETWVKSLLEWRVARVP